ncbi:IS1182 family transposase [Alkalihalophilus pseudofirmus]|uniref:IS1182 family transposase n=1 Tax=Alkalihalophilus pseudofirmus TaxID=79885 RepID=UPI000951C6D0|nr:IS1182 family transposase [Alkalihalophilus pseudofirmus]
MIKGQDSIPLSPYMGLYDLVVPKDNMLRQMNELVDFSFIMDELQDKYCLTNGRNAISPIRMFKYLLLKTIFDLSDVDVVERSKYDMSFKYFLDLAPEAGVIDPSSLTKFRKLRLPDEGLLDMLVGKSVEIAIEHNILKDPTIILDATHTRACFNKKSPKEFLQEKSKNVRKAVYRVDESMQGKFPDKPLSNDLQEELEYCRLIISTVESSKSIEVPAVKERLNVLKEVVEDYEENMIQSDDPDARTGFKSQDTSFFGYKSHLAMTNEERIITAAVITSGEKNDGKYLRELVDKTRNAGVNVDTIIADTAYSERENIRFTNEHRMELVSKLHPLVTNGSRKNDEFEFNKDAGTYMCKAGHLAIQKKYDGCTKHNKNPRYRYFFDVEKCKVCPLKEGCYKEGTKTKSYYVTVKSTEHTEQEAFQETERFKELSKSRYKVEAKNSELKNRHGYKKANYSGLFGMQIQAATTIFAVNLKRILRLKNQKES